MPILKLRGLACIRRRSKCVCAYVVVGLRFATKATPRSRECGTHMSTFASHGLQAEPHSTGTRTSTGSPGGGWGPSRPKCAREGCNFARHTDQPHGFCCNLCRANGQHGPLCQKHTWPIAPPPDDRFKLSWHPSLLFGKGWVLVKGWTSSFHNKETHTLYYRSLLR